MTTLVILIVPIRSLSPTLRLESSVTWMRVPMSSLHVAFLSVSPILRLYCRHCSLLLSRPRQTRISDGVSRSLVGQPSFTDPVKLTGAKLPDGLSVSSRARSPARMQRCATTPLSLCCASGSFRRTRRPRKRRAGRGPPQPAVLFSWMMIGGINSLTRYRKHIVLP